MSWARWVKSRPPPNPSCWRSVLILLYHQRLALPNVLFPSRFRTKVSPVSHTCYMPCPSRSPWFNETKNMLRWLVMQVIRLRVMSLSPFPRYLVPPKPKYSPQHHILKHPRLPFLPQCQRPGFTPIQTTGKIIFLYILKFKFLDGNLEDNMVVLYLYKC